MLYLLLIDLVADAVNFVVVFVVVVFVAVVVAAIAAGVFPFVVKGTMYKVYKNEGTKIKTSRC